MKRALHSALTIGLALFLGLGWIACVGIPVAVQCITLAADAPQAMGQLSASAAWRLADAPALLSVTFGWSLAIAAGAAAIGVPLGSSLGSLGAGRSGLVWTALLVAILCVPPYLLYWVWGLVRLPGSPLGAWAREAAWRASTLQVWQLWWGLVWSTWPLVALPVAAARRSVPAERIDMLLIDGAGPVQRTLLLWREIRPGILLGFGLAWISTLVGFAAFDLAATSLPLADTYGNVLRRIRFEAGAEATILASWPLMAAMLLLVFVVTALARGVELDAEVDQPQSRTKATAALFIGVFVALALPVLIMLRRLGGLEPFTRLGPLEGRAIVESLAWAAAAGAALALLALGHAFGWSHPRRFVRLFTTVSAIGWVVMGVMPAAARGACLITAQRLTTTWAGREIIPETLWATLPNGDYLAWPVLVILGYLGSFGMVSVLLGWWLARSESEELGAMRLMDGAVSLPGWLSARGAAATAAVGAAGLLGAALSLGEVSTTMIVLPAGPNSLTQRLLNKMHYAYEDSALATCLVILAIVVPLGFAASLWFGRARRDSLALGAGRGMLLLALLFSLPLGCDKPASLEEMAFEGSFIIGSTGRAPGQFIYPRAIACDPQREVLYVADKTGRVQRFDLRGRFLDAIILPRFDRGYPTGLSVHPETGRLYVADTHEHRVLVYDDAGRLESIIGSEGEQPGEMRYPTDVAFGPDGVIFVSEYGGNDRIQAFDSAGEPLYTFGSFGSGEGEFSRPQAIEYDAARGELIILDACNHRIVVTDTKGNWKFTVGGPGRGPGQLSYPYGLVVQPDGSFVVAEFGSSRIQHLARDGTCLGIYGTLGSGPGCLQTPWGLAADGRRLFVVDSRNDRVQALARP